MTPTHAAPREAGSGMALSEAAYLHGLWHDRVAELWRERQWWRTNSWADWPDIRKEHDVELRALLRLASQARRKAEAERVARPDPVELAKRYADWTETELAGAWGR